MCARFLLVVSVSQKHLTAAPWPGQGAALAGSGDVPIFLLDCILLRSIPKDVLLVFATPGDKKEAEQYFPPTYYFNASEM